MNIKKEDLDVNVITSDLKLQLDRFTEAVQTLEKIYYTYEKKISELKFYHSNDEDKLDDKIIDGLLDKNNNNIQSIINIATKFEKLYNHLNKLI